MTDRRPLGTGPTTADVPDMTDTDPAPAPRAQLAAERLPPAPLVPAAEPKPRPTTGRRALRAGPAMPGR